MNYKRYIIPSCLIICILAACDEHYSNEYTPSSEAHYLNCNIDNSDLSFASEGGKKTLSLQAENTSWCFRGMPEWLTVNPNVGNSDATVLFTAGNNKRAYIRSGIFYFESTQAAWPYSMPVISTQAAADPWIDLDKTSFAITAGHNIKTVHYTTNVDLVEASSSYSWIHPTIQKGGNVNIVVDENATDSYRNGICKIYSTNPKCESSLYIYQAAPSLLYTEVVPFENTAGRATIDLTSDIAWSVEKPSSSSWISVSPMQGKAGKCTLTMEVSPNQSEKDRKGFIYIVAGNVRHLSIPIEQRGINITVEPQELSFGAATGERQMTIHSNTSWRLSSNVDWLSYSVEEGNGDAEVIVRVMENQSTEPRQGTIVVGHPGLTAQALVEVTQRGKYFSLTSSPAIYSSHGGTHQISVGTDDAWNIHLAQHAPWVTMSKTEGTESAEVIANIADNPSIHPRNDTIIFTPLVCPVARLAIYQRARYLTIDNERLNFFAKGGTSEIITINTDASYTITKEGTDIDWLTISQDGNSFTVTVQDNPSEISREATIALSMTELAAGESYRVELPVVQRGQGESFLLTTYGRDVEWKLGNDGHISLTITNYGIDRNWNPAANNGVLRVVVDGYEIDHNWNF